MLTTLPALLTPGELTALQQRVQQVHAADPLLNYVQDLMAATQASAGSCRPSCAPPLRYCCAAKAQALLANRDYVAPDDVQAVLPQTVAHRMTPVGDAGAGAVRQVEAMIAAVPLP